MVVGHDHLLEFEDTGDVLDCDVLELHVEQLELRGEDSHLLPGIVDPIDVHLE